MKTKDLILDDKNANRHTERGLQLLEKSVRELGMGRSILIDKNNRIIGGNGIIETCNKLGVDDVQVVESDGTKIIAVKRTDIDLDTQKGRKMALADNATGAADLEWDKEALQTYEDDFAINLDEWDVQIEDYEFTADDFGDEFTLPDGDRADFRRYGFMLYGAQYDEIVKALNMAKSEKGFKAYCDAQENDNENGNAISFIVSQWVGQRKS